MPKAGRKNIGDISPLIGRHFVVASRNTLRVEKLDEGAIRLAWFRKPTERDMQEGEDWVRGILGPCDVTVCDDLKNEANALAEWKESLNG